MGYSISDKLEWTVIFILKFGRRYGLNMKLSFASVIDDISEFCVRHGGASVRIAEKNMGEKKQMKAADYITKV